VVGRSYPPEFYSWITKPHVRSLFERIATETEEDYQNIIKKLQEFDVKVLRPDLPKETFVNGQFVLPPMTPRDTMVMIGDVFYESYTCPGVYDNIYQHIRDQGNTIKHGIESDLINGAMLARIGRDLYFGTHHFGYDKWRNEDKSEFVKVADREFPNYRVHVVKTGGHSDGTYCPVCPGLIISLNDIPSYAKTFPDWEIVYLPNQSWDLIQPFHSLKQKNKGKWWIPGFEYDQDVINVVEQWLGHWTGYVEETVFDVNMLIIDPKNVMVFNYNKQVFDALDRYGITPHIVPFRHRYFWDGGVHCVTTDLHREGTIKDYFPERN
jgi:hypothetical protein